MQKIRVLTTAALALVTFLSGGGVMKAVSAENDFPAPLQPDSGHGGAVLC